MNTYLRYFIGGIALAFAWSGCEQTSNKATAFLSHPERVDALIDGYIANESFPMLYVRIENKNGETLYEHQAVNERLLPNTSVNGDHWFRIWSMSKIITISIIMDLVEEGVVRLSDPMAKYIPEFSALKIAVDAQGKPLGEVAKAHFDAAGFDSGPYENNPSLSQQHCPYQLQENTTPITVEDLINHQAGFYYATTPFTCLNAHIDALAINTLKSTDEIIDRMAELPLIISPGSTDFYGLNTTVLGFVAERAMGKSLNTLFEERIQKPLGIEGIQYKRTEDISLFPVYSGVGDSLRLAHDGELDIMGATTINYAPAHRTYLGGEGMLATADGYTDFLRMLLNKGSLNGHRFLETTSVEQMTAPQTQLDNDWGYNGYNLWVTSDKVREMGYGDAGLWTGGGYEQTHFWIDPQREILGVIMSQMFGVPPQGYDRDNKIRGEIYNQLFAKE